MDISQPNGSGADPALLPPIPDLAEQARQMLAQIRARLAEAQAVLTGAAEQQGVVTATVTHAATTLETAKQVLADAQTFASSIATSAATATEQARQIKESQEQTSKIRTAMDSAQSALAVTSTETAAHNAAAKTASESCNELLEKVRESVKLNQEELKQITDSRIGSKKSEELLSAMSAKASTAEAQITKYETRLAELEQESSEKLMTIVGLLPGAASAGLATAFDERRKTFTGPSLKWQYIFVGSIAFLVLLAGSSLIHVYQASTTLSYDELFRLWLARFPVAGALVWLAIHASRESSLAKRLEEDYGYKAAIAASFLGFNKQMSDLNEKAGSNTPLATLCADTLATIASPPGRIYDKHKLTATPTDKLKDLIKESAGILNGSKSAT